MFFVSIKYFVKFATTHSRLKQLHCAFLRQTILFIETTLHEIINFLYGGSAKLAREIQASIIKVFSHFSQETSSNVLVVRRYKFNMMNL